MDASRAGRTADTWHEVLTCRGHTARTRRARRRSPMSTTPSAAAPRLDTVASRYDADGFCFPLRVISESEAAAHLARVVALESAGEGEEQRLRSHAHLAYRFIDDLARTPAILDAVARILGRDLLLWGSSCFIKAPHSRSYVSWHQDLNYWGLDGTEEVSAWLALSASNETNGGMRFVPGSHRRGPVAHLDSFAKDNLLSRGQELAVAVEEHEAVPVCLAPGEISLHHGRMFHASGPNTTAGWRVGLALRYVSPSTRQSAGPRDFAQLVRGEDRFGHFEALPRPARDGDPAGIRNFDHVKEVRHAILYAGAARSPEAILPSRRGRAPGGPQPSAAGA